MRFDATVADSGALRRKTPRAVFVTAVLAFGLLPGMRALAGEPDAPAAASVHVSMIGPALRSSDLDRSIKFYEQGLGMHVLRTIKMGSTTEVILGFGGGIGQPVILLYKDDAPGKSPAIEQGNGFGRIVLRVDDATALSARLTAAGYTPDEMHADAVSKRKVFWATDPDGFRYEITQAPPSQ